MNTDSPIGIEIKDAADTRPILIIPYMWIGDFVRGHTVVRVLRQRWPNRPVDLLVTSLCAPLVDYMPGVRSGIVWDLPRGRLAVAKQAGVAGLLRCTDSQEPARLLAERGSDVWVVGGPGETALAQEIVAASGGKVRDLTGTDLRNGILAMAAASVAISNDSGLMHIAAAIGTPTMGIFGPTSPYHWAPLNGLAATVQTKTVVPCQPCHRPVCTMNDHRCMRDIPPSDVVEIAERVLSEAGARVAH